MRPEHKRAAYRHLEDFFLAEASLSSLQVTLRLPWGTESLQQALSSSRSLAYLQYLMQDWEDERPGSDIRLLRLFGIYKYRTRQNFHPAAFLRRARSGGSAKDRTISRSAN